MRLINVIDMQMHSFLDLEAPDYAILSHRWGKEEVSFQDFHGSPARDSLGYRKIKKFCEYIRQAFLDIEYVWIDTCCIDKTSSAELSETINSMYQYYQMANVCVTYLYDVTAERCGSQHTSFSDPLCQGCSVLRQQYLESEYFLRGWTLQELVAPEVVVFLNRDWRLIGRKHTDARSEGLLRLLSEITRIPTSVLQNTNEVFHQSIAQRLSWAGGRKTTRGEDVAYSLFGLLGLNMPLLYGEGRRGAWNRLLEEVVRTSNDETIFTGSVGSIHDLSPGTTLFPRNPGGYAACSQMIRHIFHPRSPYAITNQGLEMKLEAGAAMSYRDSSAEQTWLAIQLNCVARQTLVTPVFLLLKMRQRCGHYDRQNPSSVDWENLPAERWQPAPAGNLYVHLHEDCSADRFMSRRLIPFWSTAGAFERWTASVKRT